MTTSKTVSDSYISDVTYDSSYKPYLNPLNLHYIALHAGLRRGKLSPNFSYCDLGCGNGTILNFIASMFPNARFFGVDFNKEHIAIARRNADSTNIDNVVYRQLDFSRLEPEDFPSLDFINCFGTFSWINKNLQDAILQFAGQSLGDSGIFTVHYAAKPGKVQIEPLWHLMRMLTEDVTGSSTERARAGVEAIGTLRKSGAQFFKENPVAHARANAFTSLDLNNLAHESLTEWHTFHLSEIAGSARKQGLQYAGLQSPMDNEPDFTIPDKYRLILDGHTDPIVRSSVEDYILNRGLRSDVYVKAASIARSDTAPDTQQPMWLTSPDGAIKHAITTPCGNNISLESPLIDSIVAELRQGVRSAMELHGKPAFSSWSKDEIVCAIARLVASGQVKPVIGKPLFSVDAVSCNDLRPAAAMTREILRGYIPASGFIYLPSPLLGQSVPVDQLIGLSLSALLYQTGNEVNWVAEQIRIAGVAGMQGVATQITKGEVTNIAGDAFQMTTSTVLPALLRLGVYEHK